jgi:hypothetical protein
MSEADMTEPRKRPPTPIRDGDWRVIDGQLVDLREHAPASAPAGEPQTPSPPPAQSRRGKRNRKGE